MSSTDPMIESEEVRGAGSERKRRQMEADEAKMWDEEQCKGRSLELELKGGNEIRRRTTKGMMKKQLLLLLMFSSEVDFFQFYIASSSVSLFSILPLILPVPFLDCLQHNTPI